MADILRKEMADIWTTQVNDYGLWDHKINKVGEHNVPAICERKVPNGDEWTRYNWKQWCAKLFTPGFLYFCTTMQYGSMVIYTKETHTLCCYFPHSQFIAVIYDTPNRHSKFIVNSRWTQHVRNLRFVVKSKQLYFPDLLDFQQCFSWTLWLQLRFWTLLCF